jgi:hypothetical protein
LGCGSGGGNRPPVLLSLEVSQAEVSEDAPVILLATVVDPDGAQDLLGGSLRTASGDLVGVFSARGNGLFELELDLADFGAVAPFDFYERDGRTYSAIFLDTEQHQAAGQIALAFRCPARHGGCGTACQPLDRDAACGACARACAPADQACDASLARPACASAVPFTRFIAMYAEVLCHRIYACCDATEQDQIEDGHFEEATGCTAYYATHLATQVFNRMIPLVDSGRVLYDPLLAASCLEAYREVSCSQGIEARMLEGCERIFTGQVAAYQACTLEVECVPGTECVLPQGEQEGTCVPTLGVGQVCLPGQVPACGVGLYCDSLSHVCAPKKAAGEGCSLHAECQAGMRCEANMCAVSAVTTCDGI